jgi:hypothetical protein
MNYIMITGIYWDYLDDWNGDIYFRSVLMSLATVSEYINTSTVFFTKAIGANACGTLKVSA